MPVSPSARKALVGIGLLSIIKAIGWILIATSVARGITHLATGQPAPDAARLLNLLFQTPSAPPGVVEDLAASAHTSQVIITLVLGITGGLLRAAASWGEQILATRAALGEKEYLRAQLVDHRLNAAGAHADRSAQDAVLAATGLDGLDDYFTQFLPALVQGVAIPIILGGWILIHDWVSALVLVITLPLIPLFMILIGRFTESRIHQAAEGLNNLSHQLSELARGLPVIIGLRRTGFQRKALQDVSERYNRTTLSTLRTAFLSGLALELISTISVAVIAVFIGVRLVGGSIELYAGLMVLTIAAEVYLPFRDMGAAFHSSEDGREALRRAQNHINQPLPTTLPETLEPEATETGVTQWATDTGEAVLEDLSVSYKALTEIVHDKTTPVRYLTQAEFNIAKQEDRESDKDKGPDIEYREEILDPVIDHLSLRLQPSTLTVLTASSGTGKTTLLRGLAGNLRDGEALFTGTAKGLNRPTVWLGQHPVFTEETVLDELAFVARGTSNDPLDDQAVEELISTALEAVALSGFENRAVEELSPGERRRLGMARVLARLLAAPETKNWLVLLDEPTAHLDPDSAQQIRHTLGQLRDGHLPNGESTQAMILAASHDVELYGLADQLVDENFHAEATESAPQPTAASNSRAEDGKQDEPVDTATATSSTGKATLKDWLTVLPWNYPKFWYGVLLSTATMLAAGFLAAMSGWLIVQASYQPPVLYLLAVIVAVRFFGIGRAVFRYAERMVVHDAVLNWAKELRLKIWDALGNSASHWSRLTRSGGVLSTLITDVDELRDAVPRVLVPIPTTVLTWLVSFGVVAYMAPEAAWPVLVAGLVLLIGLPPLLLKLDSKTAGILTDHRAGVLQRTAGLFTAAGDLFANGLTGAAMKQFRSDDSNAAQPLKRNAFVAGLGQAVMTAVIVWAAAHTLWLGIAHGIAAPNVALSVMMILSLVEPFGLYSSAIHESATIRHQLNKLAPLLGTKKNLGEWVNVETPNEDNQLAGVTTTGFELEKVATRYGPDLPKILDDFSLSGSTGDFRVITGPSGSGKSTVLALMLGFLKPTEGSYTLTSSAADAQSALRTVAWCPQDAYLFDSSLKSNLLLASDHPREVTEDQLRDVLELVGLGDWLASVPAGLDTRLGPSGHFLSGGQRQRVAVARALLAEADVVLLDEPTAHLGADEAAQLVSDLQELLVDQTVVMVTHDERFNDLPGALTLRPARIN